MSSNARGRTGARRAAPTRPFARLPLVVLEVCVRRARRQTVPPRRRPCRREPKLLTLRPPFVLLARRLKFGERGVRTRDAPIGLLRYTLQTLRCALELPCAYAPALEPGAFLVITVAIADRNCQSVVIYCAVLAVGQNGRRQQKEQGRSSATKRLYRPYSPQSVPRLAPRSGGLGRSACAGGGVSLTACS